MDPYNSRTHPSSAWILIQKYWYLARDLSQWYQSICKWYHPPKSVVLTSRQLLIWPPRFPSWIWLKTWHRSQLLLEEVPTELNLVLASFLQQSVTSACQILHPSTQIWHDCPKWQEARGRNSRQSKVVGATWQLVGMTRPSSPLWQTKNYEIPSRRYKSDVPWS